MTEISPVLIGKTLVNGRIYIFERRERGWVVGQFPENNSCMHSKNCGNKSRARGAMKNRASVFYSPGAVFDVKKIHAQTIAHPKK